MLLAHRGNTEKYQENTADALYDIKKFHILNGFNNKTFGVEFDVQQLKTGEIIIYHDQTLNRLHKNNRLATEIDKHTAVLYGIPFLSNVLDSFNGTKLILDIEIKLYTTEHYKNICNTVAKMVIDRNMTNTCILTCFDSNVVMFLLKNYPILKSCLIVNTSPSTLILRDLTKNGMKKIVVHKNEFIRNVNQYIKLEPIVYCLDPDDPIVSTYHNIDIITDSIDKYVYDPKYFDPR
jgi:glycerophosphoryl diester phosphodiesterase